MNTIKPTELVDNYVVVSIDKNSVRLMAKNIETTSPYEIHIHKRIFNQIMPQVTLYGNDYYMPLYITEREFNGKTLNWLAIPKTI